MKIIILMIQVLLISKVLQADEIILQNRIENYFSMNNETCGEYVFVAYPVNTSIGTANYSFIELNNEVSYKVECDDIIPVIYGIKREDYKPEEIFSILNQKAGPVTPYSVEVYNILSSNYIHITEIECFPFVEEGSKIANRYYSIKIALVNDVPEVSTFEIINYDSAGNEIVDYEMGFLNNPSSRFKFFMVLSILSAVSLISVVVIKKYKR